MSANYGATVSSIALLSLGPTGSVFDVNQATTTMDFGTLSPGQSLSDQALFKSNDSAGYTAYMRSDNAGRLKLAGATATIPYSLALSSSNSPNLAGIVTTPSLASTDFQVATGIGVAPAAGDKLNITATIGSFEARALASGVYSNVITLMIIGN